MPKLSVLLWVDDEFHDDEGIAIDHSLGDKFLLAMNPIFARIRRLTIDCGGRYSTDATPAWRDYQNAPLFCLGMILDTGVIPYVANGETLRRIVASSPTVDVDGRAISRLLKKNVVMHESAHLCADRILNRPIVQGNDRSEFVLRCLIAESLANMIELVVGSLADSDMHRLFFLLNSYITIISPRVSLLRASLLIAGLRDIMRLGLVTYLYLNSHESSVPDNFADKAIERVVPGLSPEDSAILRQLVNTGFALSYTFRADTTPLFFSLYNSVQDYRLFAEGFTDPFTLDERIMSMIDTLVTVVFPPTDEELTKLLKRRLGSITYLGK